MMEAKLHEAAEELMDRLHHVRTLDHDTLYKVLEDVVREKLTDSYYVSVGAINAAYYAKDGNRVGCISELERTLRLAKHWHERCENG